MKTRIPKQPPISNRYVAPGCEPFASKPLTKAQQIEAALSNAKSGRIWFTATPRVPLCSDMRLLRRKPRAKHTRVLVIPL